MKRLLEKIKDKGGASILMALLLLLICVMVAASMMAAASSDTGKYRSVRTEQQKYLTLTSGIGVLRDALAKTGCYTGKYDVYEWTEEIRTKHTGVDPDTGSEYTYETSEFTDYFYVVQKEGVLDCYGIEEYIGLKSDLDHAFGDLFDISGSGYERLEIDGWTPAPHEFRVVMPDGFEGYHDGSDPSKSGVYGVTRTVILKSELNASSYHIDVSAWLGNVDNHDYVDMPENKNDTLFAELIPIKDAEGSYLVPKIDYDPVGRTPGEGPYVSGVALGANQTRYIYANRGDAGFVDVSDADAVSAAFGDTERSTAGTSWVVYWMKKGVA